MRSIDITGQRFGRLTALRIAVRGGEGPHRRRQRWLFRCDCGNDVEAGKDSVMRGTTRSCGCLQAEITIQRNKQSVRHGHTSGAHRSSEWVSWQHMRQRCSNPNHVYYKNYGGRGIRIDPRWDDFENFLTDMGGKPSPEHEIDRIDSNGNYEPGNVRWTLPIEQANNKRNSRYYTIDGRRQTIAQWAREYSIDPQKLRKRIDAGWSPEIIRALLRIYRERASPPMEV
jgi:hypothetical protein